MVTVIRALTGEGSPLMFYELLEVEIVVVVVL